MKRTLLFIAMLQSISAGDVSSAIKHFYVELKATEIRGNPDEDRCDDALTPSFKAIIAKGRKTLEASREEARQAPEQYEATKLDFTEGSVYTASYEYAAYVRTENIEEHGDRAYARVTLRLDERDGGAEFSDLVILHKIDNEWKIDDILSFIADPKYDREPVSIRRNFNIDN